MRTMFTLSFSTFLAAATVGFAQDDLMQNYPGRYMGAEANVIEGPNGALIYDEALKQGLQIAYAEPTVQEVTDGIWIVGGHSIANFTVIEAPDGLIVYDTGDNAEEGAHLRKAIEEQISKKPIKAIIYSHSHYALGGGALVDDPTQVMVIGHPRLNDTVKTNLEGGGAPSAIPEIGPVLSARMNVQFNNYLPREGADSALANVLAFKTPAFLPATKTVEDGEIVNVAGLELQFFTKYISDDYTVTAWLPEKKVVMNNFFWPGTPNLYSLRGAVYRDPQVWRDGLKVLRNLKPEHLMNTHAKAISGAEKVDAALTSYMDLVTLTYDQTLRGILHGLGPDDLRYFVYQPKSLSDPYYNAQSYGESHWFPPAIYQYQMGWFDGDPSQMAKLPRTEAANRLVKLLGGEDEVVAAAQAAHDEKEYAWAAELVQNVYLINPANTSAIKIKADAMRQMGYLSIAAIGRAFYLSEALDLEEVIDIPTVVPPSVETVTAAPTTFVNYFRVRIDPRAVEALALDKLVIFDFGDSKAGLHIRNGIAEFVPEPDDYDRQVDLTLSMTPDTWAELYLSRTDVEAATGDGKIAVADGSSQDAIEIFTVFDKFSADGSSLVPVVTAAD